MTIAAVLERCHKLGLTGDELPTDKLSSILAALACFPMYMVANVHAWTTDRQWHIPVLDLPGFEEIRESFEIGRQEAVLHMERAHRRVLGAMLSHARPSDLVIYEYALEALAQVLPLLAAPLAEQLRTAIARMVVAVAEASGKGILGTGTKISEFEKSCIEQIDRVLSLSGVPAAAKILEAVHKPA
jgi:hypothetical protein